MFFDDLNECEISKPSKPFNKLDCKKYVLEAMEAWKATFSDEYIKQHRSFFDSFKNGFNDESSSICNTLTEMLYKKLIK